MQIVQFNLGHPIERLLEIAIAFLNLIRRTVLFYFSRVFPSGEFNNSKHTIVLQCFFPHILWQD